MNTPETIDVAAEVTPGSQAVATRPAAPVAAVGQQESFESLMALAKELCSTGFLPQAVKTPAQAVAIILTGRELGLGPMQALRSICIIQGKPELAADLQLSIFHRDGGRSKWLALTEAKAELWLRHPNGDEHTETFTMDDARRAGLANGQNWQKYPKAMLRSRAITAGLKSIGFEPLSGAYAPGEIGGPEIVGPEPETVPEAPKTPQEAPKPAARPPEPSKPAPAAPTPQPQAPKPRYATKETLAWMIKELSADYPDMSPVNEFLQKVTIGATSPLTPMETIEHLPMRWVPVTRDQLKQLKAAITDFLNGNEPVMPYGPNEEAPPPKKEPTAPKAESQPPAAPQPTSASTAGKTEKDPDPEWFLDIIVPVPPKGVRRDDYLKNPDTIRSLFDQRHEQTADGQAARQRLYGFCHHFEPKGWQKRDGTQMPPSAADIRFREALDAFADWHEKQHPNEKL